MSDTAQDVFEIMRTTRPMRRLSPDPVPDELIERVLDAGTWAPNSLNAQPYRFLVMRDRESVAFFAERYDKAIKRGFAGLTLDPADSSPRARNIRVALSFGERMADVPVLLVICGVRDWPFAVPQDQRVGVPPPSYGSVYPCVQNMLLACRALGLGASLTTIHQLFEGELCAGPSRTTTGLSRCYRSVTRWAASAPWVGGRRVRSPGMLAGVRARQQHKDRHHDGHVDRGPLARG